MASGENYNCGGMTGIDYSKPGAQAFISSWADEFASWGVDYLKLDGVGDSDVGDVQAWSAALQQTGRPIHLELSGLFNYGGSASQTVTVSLAAAGIHGSATATNLWTGGSAGTLSRTYSVTLGPGAVQLLKLVPVAGTAGATTYQAASSASQ